MGNIKVEYFPPMYWQEFEMITADVCRKKWSDDYIHRYGREGQAQNGIDIFGYDKVNGEYIAVQCKKKSNTKSNGQVLTGGVLTENIIKDELDKLKNCPFSFDNYIIATTAYRDKNIQDFVIKLNQSKVFNYSVHLWFWEDYVEYFNNNDDLVYRYYESLLHMRNTYDLKRHYLQLIRMAFDRPVFKTRFNLENNLHDFLEAISATQNALSTGRLLDNNGRIIDEVLMTKKKVVSTTKLLKLLQKIRNIYTEGLQNKLIIQHNSYIEICDYEIANKIDIIRGELLKVVNELLRLGDIEIIESELLL